MTTTTRNRAAERLILEFGSPGNTIEEFTMWLGEALAAERRATVERIRAAVDLAHANSKQWATHSIATVNAILDEEAVR